MESYRIPCTLSSQVEKYSASTSISDKKVIQEDDCAICLEKLTDKHK